MSTNNGKTLQGVIDRIGYFNMTSLNGHLRRTFQLKGDKTCYMTEYVDVEISLIKEGDAVEVVVLRKADNGVTIVKLKTMENRRPLEARRIKTASAPQEVA